MHLKNSQTARKEEKKMTSFPILSIFPLFMREKIFYGVIQMSIYCYQNLTKTIKNVESFKDFKLKGTKECKNRIWHF